MYIEIQGSTVQQHEELCILLKLQFHLSRLGTFTTNV